MLSSSRAPAVPTAPYVPPVPPLVGPGCGQDNKLPVKPDLLNQSNGRHIFCKKYESKVEKLVNQRVGCTMDIEVLKELLAYRKPSTPSSPALCWYRCDLKEINREL